MQETGLREVPFVAVMYFLIGVLLAFQGSEQPRQFGAVIFVIDLIAISILRELGILLTAIVVAGRKVSPLTASIGLMKMRRKVIAIRTLGPDPDMVLILPCILALTMVLPILGLISAVAGLPDGAMMAWVELGISPDVFLARLADFSVTHVIVGLAKAPVFAPIIGGIGCHAGMLLGKQTESLGRIAVKCRMTANARELLSDLLSPTRPRTSPWRMVSDTSFSKSSLPSARWRHWGRSGSKPNDADTDAPPRP